MSKDAPKAKVIEVENSVELRIMNYIMVALTIVAYCIYSEAPFVVTVGCITVSALGSYLSYVFRSRKSYLVNVLILAGTFGVLGHFVFEAIKQFFGGGQFLPAFMQVLCGLLIVLTFDLRQRTDIYVAATVSLGLMGCVASQTGKSNMFGIFPMGFIIGGAIFLYLVAISHSREGNPAQVSASTRPTQPQALNIPQPLWKRPATGGALVAVVTLPVASMMIFCLMPRAGTSIVDLIADQARILMARAYEKMHPPQASQPSQMVPIPPRTQANGAGPPPTGEKGKGQKGDGGKGGKGTKGSGGKGQGGKGQGEQEEREGHRAGPKEKMSGYKPGTKPDGKNGKPGTNGQSGANGAGTPQPGVDGPPERPRPQMGLAQKRDAAVQDVIVMTVSSNRPVYLRGMAFDTYEGQRWVNSKNQQWSELPKMDEDTFEIAGVRSLHLPANFRGSEVEQRIEVKEPLDLTIPCGWIPQVIHFPGELRVATDGSLESRENLKPGLFYTAVSMVPSADLDELRSARMPTNQQLDSIRASSARFLQLPKNYDPQIKLLAKEIGGRDGNWFVHAERVANYLKANCSYLNNNSELEPDVDSVANFLLTTKSGSCSIFASAEAILLRAQGIPSRVVFGYMPGDKDPKSDAALVKKKHEHAWAEVFIPTHGWVPIDATPNGTLPVQPFQDAQGGRVLLKSTHQASPSPAPAQAGKNEPPSAWGWAKKLSSNPYVIAILIAVGVFLLYEIGRKFFAQWQSQKTAAEVTKNMKPSTALYLRLLNDLEKVAVSKTTSDTPADVATAVRAKASESPAFPQELKSELPHLVDNFVEAYYLERFSNMEESVEEGNKLGEIGDKIHALVLESTLTSAQRN
jgi:transglutaminase-like putative cysteine protease